jgi:hypothetical protein
MNLAGFEKAKIRRNSAKKGRKRPGNAGKSPEIAKRMA